MKTYRLKVEAFCNPYMIDHCLVDEIIFYNDSGIVLTHEKGWFGSRRTKIDQFENLEFVKRTKVSLTRKEHFFIRSNRKTTLYVYTPSIDFGLLGEKVATKNEYELNYGMYFELFGKEYMCAYFVGRELTPLGEQREKIENFFNGCRDEFEFVRAVQTRFDELKKIMDQ